MACAPIISIMDLSTTHYDRPSLVQCVRVSASLPRSARSPPRSPSVPTSALIPTIGTCWLPRRSSRRIHSILQWHVHFLERMAFKLAVAPNMPPSHRHLLQHRIFEPLESGAIYHERDVILSSFLCGPQGDFSLRPRASLPSNNRFFFFFASYPQYLRLQIRHITMARQSVHFPSRSPRLQSCPTDRAMVTIPLPTAEGPQMDKLVPERTSPHFPFTSPARPPSSRTASPTRSKSCPAHSHFAKSKSA